MRFLGSKFTQNALVAGAPPRTPLGAAKALPRPLADFRGRWPAGERERGEKREEGKGKGILGKGKKKGREEGTEGKGKEGKGGEGEFASLALGG